MAQKSPGAPIRTTDLVHDGGDLRLYRVGSRVEAGHIVGSVGADGAELGADGGEFAADGVTGARFWEG